MQIATRKEAYMFAAFGSIRLNTNGTREDFEAAVILFFISVPLNEKKNLQIKTI